MLKMNERFIIRNKVLKVVGRFPGQNSLVLCCKYFKNQRMIDYGNCERRKTIFSNFKRNELVDKKAV